MRTLSVFFARFWRSGIRKMLVSDLYGGTGSAITKLFSIFISSGPNNTGFLFLTDFDRISDYQVRESFLPVNLLHVKEAVALTMNNRGMSSDCLYC